MKKLLILPLLLLLILFSLYHNEAEGNIESRESNTSSKSKILEVSKEIVETYNMSYDELNNSEEKKEEEKPLKLKIEGELNTTKEKVLYFSAKLENIDNVEGCNYFWYENGEPLTMGRKVELSFTKGEHPLFIKAKCGEKETNTTVTVNAYDYYMVERFHYDAYYGTLEYKEKEIQNHLGRYLLRDDGTWSKDSYEYNEENRMVENKSEYYLYPEETKIVRYEYDEEGHIVKETTLDVDGNVIYIIARTYDDKGEILTTMGGADENSLSEENYKNRYGYYDEETYYKDNATDEVEQKDEHKRLFNEDNQTIYSEDDYGDMKIVIESEYNEKKQLSREHRVMTTVYGSRENTVFYDDQQNTIKRESKRRSNYNGGEYFCHKETKMTYNKEGQRVTSQEVLLGGECYYLNEAEQHYSYDKDGRVKTISSSFDGEKGYTTLKVVETYTNELDIW